MILSFIKRMLKTSNKQEKSEDISVEPIQYTKEELSNAKYIIEDVFWVTLRRKLKTKEMKEPKREVKTILAVRSGEEEYMDIETGAYYNARRYISDLNEVNVWTAYEMPYRFYVMETLMDKHIEYDDSFTAIQLRDLIRTQRQKYKTPMYDSGNWGINK